MTDRPLITPHLKVGELLEAYPELEDVLIGIAPEFARLRSPLLRKTVARLTTLEQAARVGGVGLGDLINRLRAAAGSEEAYAGQAGGPGADTAADERPDWVDWVAVVSTHDARAEIEAGAHPLPQVMAAVAALAPGQAHVLVTPFVPAPLLDKVRAQGLRVWTEADGPNTFRNLLARVD